MQLQQFVSSRDSCQPQQAIQPTHSATASKKEESEEKGEIEKEVATTSRNTGKGKSSKISTEGENSVSQMGSVSVKKNQIKRRNDDLKNAVDAFNNLVDINLTKELVEYFK